MRWFESRRRRSIMAASAMLLLATACGGGKSPTGPGNGPGGGNDNGIAGDYQLASIGKVELGTVLNIENCVPVRFHDGQMRFYDDGTWDFAVDIETPNGFQEYDDSGDYQENGGTVLLDSDYGYSFQGKFDGQEAKLDYDFCPNGQTDIRLVFDK